MSFKFSKWVKWKDRNSLKGIDNPGIYCIAISDEVLSGKTFKWSVDIKYIGMTNSKTGLKGRLQQFDNTIIGKTGHGGADRFRYKHQDYEKLISKLYVSVQFFDCDVASNNPNNLLIMGDVARFEYVCFAEFVKKFGNLPEFNDKPNAKKYSLEFKKGNINL